MTTESSERTEDEIGVEELAGKTFHVGPPQEPFWKYQVAKYVFWLVRLSPVAKYVQKLPGALPAGKWAFRVTVLSREFTEVIDGE